MKGGRLLLREAGFIPKRAERGERATTGQQRFKMSAVGQMSDVEGTHNIRVVKKADAK